MPINDWANWNACLTKLLRQFILVVLLGVGFDQWIDLFLVQLTVFPVTEAFVVNPFWVTHRVGNGCPALVGVLNNDVNVGIWISFPTLSLVSPANNLTTLSVFGPWYGLAPLVVRVDSVVWQCTQVV